MNYKNNLFELIGNTPMLKLNRLFKDFNIFAKIERFNPTGSIKDRTAFGIIQHGLQEGLINESTILIEPTSGNTGIALSAIASYLGLQAIIVMPENMSKERVDLIEAYGAKVIKTSKEKGMQGAIDYVNEQIKLNNNYFSLYQFASIYNPLIHYNTTAKEIDEALDSNVDVIIAGIGTGGTISGVSKYFKERYPNTLIIGVEPSGSPVITKGYKGPHKIQGIGAGFVPETLDVSLVDEFVTITDEEAYIYTKKMVKTEGLLVGISSGAALACAAKFKERFKNKNVVVILPDAGERYISTGVFNEL